MGVLFCAAIGAASAQEEYSRGLQERLLRCRSDRRPGNRHGRKPGAAYNALGGEATPETADIVEYYNNQTTIFNDQVVPYVNASSTRSSALTTTGPLTSIWWSCPSYPDLGLDGLGAQAASPAIFPIFLLLPQPLRNLRLFSPGPHLDHLPCPRKSRRRPEGARG